MSWAPNLAPVPADRGGQRSGRCGQCDRTIRMYGFKSAASCWLGDELASAGSGGVGFEAD